VAGKINIKSISVNLSTLWTIFKIVKGVFKKREKEVVVKAGTKTSELWLTVGFNVLGIALMVGGSLNPELTIKVLAAMNGIYLIGRNLVKMTATDLDDKAIEKLGELIEKNKK
jgi:hypothetical protein